VESEAAIADYYAKGSIVDYVAATYRGGKSCKPLVAGAAMFSADAKQLDLHFVNF